MTLKIDIPRLYRAGKEEIPEEARRIATIAEDLADVLGSFNTMTAGAGDPAALRNLLKVGGDVYDELRSTVGTLNDVSIAVIKTAKHFRETDSDAEQQYQHLRDGLKDHHQVPQADEPRDIGAIEEKGANDDEGSRIESTPAPTDPR